MFSIHDEEKLKEFFKENKIEPYRMAQLQNAIYKNFKDNFDDINTLSKEIRQKLKEQFSYIDFQEEQDYFRS